MLKHTENAWNQKFQQYHKEIHKKKKLLDKEKHKLSAKQFEELQNSFTEFQEVTQRNLEECQSLEKKN